MINKITLSGYAGSGKSTVGKIIEEKLNFKFISIGNFSREFAKREFGLNINEFQETCRLNPKLDHAIDEKFKEECNNQENIIVDYRLGFHFIKNAFHILLKVTDSESVKRIKLDNRDDEKLTMVDIKRRNKNMRSRFKSIYNVDFTDEKNYDLVIDTDGLTAGEVADIIINHFLAFRKTSDSKPKGQRKKQNIPSVNFHLWEPCNMRCKFCFATFQDVKQTILPKGHLPEKEAIEIVNRIADAGFEKITFAGGEPLLCKWLPSLIKTAKQKGMTTMIVTNGSKLTDEFLKENKDHLDWIAISIDSLEQENNIKIGRAIVGKRALTKDYYFELLEKIKNHGYGLKINTVVNKINFRENLSDLITYANPKRWKVLQVLPILGQNDTKIDDFKITNKEFKHFLETHKNIKSIVPESNDEIKGSYVMVDPAGRFFDNAEGTHNYSKPILEVGIKEALKSMNYDLDKFLDRGGIYDWQKKNESFDRKEDLVA